MTVRLDIPHPFFKLTSYQANHLFRVYLTVMASGASITSDSCQYCALYFKGRSHRDAHEEMVQTHLRKSTKCLLFNCGRFFKMPQSNIGARERPHGTMEAFVTKKFQQVQRENMCSKRSTTNFFPECHIRLLPHSSVWAWGIFWLGV